MSTALSLTEQQCQALAAQQGRPVEVVDPVTNRVYVLVAAEIYQRVKDMLQVAPGSFAPREDGTEPEDTRLQRPSEVRPLPQSLKELQTPPEVAAETRRYCKKLGLSRKRSVTAMEEELKLQYYFGGRYVAYLQTDNGKVVVAAGALDEAFDRQLDVLSPEERRKVVLYLPPQWHGEVSSVPTPIAHED